MEALSPRDINAQVRPKQPPQKSKLAPTTVQAPATAPALKRAKDHPPPPPDEVFEPASAQRPDGAVYRMGRLLGKGGFAICYEGQISKTKEVFALKIVKSQMAQKKMEQKFQTELQIHSKMQHANIVEFFRAFSFDESTYIALELCPNGSLMDLTKKRKYLTEPEVRYYTVQITGGIKYMHAKGIIHRDLKMGNIFLDAQMNAKIGDFGLAALLMSGHDITAVRRTTLCGTPNYIAPEILEKGKGHDQKVDIWSLGVIVYAMLTGQPPFTATKQEDIYRKAKNRDFSWPEREGSTDAISEEVQDLVADLFQKAEDRPEPDTIIQHPFFTCGWFPANDELSPICIDTPPQFPTAVRAKLKLKNFKEACDKSGLGESTVKTKLVSTWKQCAAEAKEGLTPIVPLAEGVVYFPYLSPQRDTSSMSLNQEPKPSTSQVKIAAHLRKYDEAMAAPPKSFAAQQRAQHPGASTSNSVASKVVNKVRSIREESNQRFRQVSGSTGVPSEPSRGLSALPMRKSGARVRNVQNKDEDIAPPAKKIRETNPSVKDSLSTDLVEKMAGSTLNKKGQESHFGPSESLEFIPGTRPDDILENIRRFRTELLRALESKAPIAHQRTVPATPTVVVKWVDYTNKFGLGYILSNGSVGCIFKSLRASFANDPMATTPPSCVVVRDAERHLQNRHNEMYDDRLEIVPMSGYNVEFYEKPEEGVCRVKVSPRSFKIGDAGVTGGPGRLPPGKDIYDNRRREKLVLWKKFANYMIANGRDQENAILGGPIDTNRLTQAELEDASNVMILYQRFGDVGCWAFGDGHFQFNFPDHTKLVISEDGTWCDFYHLPLDAARELLRTGNLPPHALDERQHLSYPIQTLLNFVSKPRAKARGRPPANKTLEIDPSKQEIPEANQFRDKIKFIVNIVTEWIDNGGIGNSAMDAQNRLRWTGARQTVGVVAPYKHVWVTVGAARGDDRRSAFFDPNRPGDVVEDIQS